MEMNNSLQPTKEEIIKTLQGIVVPALRCLNSLKFEERKQYAPYLIGGKDAHFKLRVLAYKRLYTRQVIQELLRRDKSLCKTYLEVSKQLLIRDNVNLAEFKRQVIASNQDNLIRLLLNFYQLTPWEEADLLENRFSHRPFNASEDEPDELMKYYFTNFHLCSPAKKLLHRPYYSYYWKLYCETVDLSRYAKLLHRLRLNMYKVRHFF